MSFWVHQSIEELAAEQGVTPVDLDEMVDRDASPEELDAFLRALADPDPLFDRERDEDDDYADSLDDEAFERDAMSVWDAVQQSLGR